MAIILFPAAPILWKALPKIKIYKTLSFRKYFKATLKIHISQYLNTSVRLYFLKQFVFVNSIEI